MSDPITRLNVALQGRYDIERMLGEGGMATVYLAHDVKHERKVALKVLKPELAAVVGAERFLAEIKTTANLQHPHILPLFDSGAADSFLFYVMPYVVGESLRDRLDREHQLPVDEAVRIATNIAEALDHAHRHGVIHRDIKPANILLQDGKPVVSDFGIALAVTTGGAGRLTETGLSLGTPHYMSPEQATGDVSVGAGTDIYALGCVLYEMLVGEPPYTGSTPQAVLGKIIQAKPVSATEVRRTVPANVDAVIRRALEKVPADRFHRAADLVTALGDAGFRHTLGAGPEAAQGSARTGSWNRLTAAFASLAAAFAMLAGWSLLGPASSAPAAEVRRFEINLPEGGAFTPAAVQPLALTADGASIVASMIIEGRSALYVRALGSLEMVPIRGTENVGSFFPSPDGAWIGFNDTQAQALVKVPQGGGPSSTIVAIPGSLGGFRGAHWGDAGFIVYAIGAHTGLMRVPDVGGVPDTLTAPAEGEVHRFPYVLPGGGSVLFASTGNGGEPQVALLSLESGEYELLTQGDHPHYVRGCFLVFRRGGALWAAAFDAGQGRLTGDPVPIVEGMRSGNRFFALSDDGTLVFVTGTGGSGGDLVLVETDLEGGERRLPLGARPIASVGWSPDGRSVVFESDNHIYTYDVVLNTAPRQITFEGDNALPVYSPDGTRVAFSSQGQGTDVVDLFVKDLTDDSAPRSILSLEGYQLMAQWPTDTLIVFESVEFGLGDLWMVDLSDPERPEARPYLTSEADLRRATVSPDGRLAAYRSNESGRSEIYIRSFPTPGERTVLSRQGGAILGWSPDGSTLYQGVVGSLGVRAIRLGRGPVPVVLSTDTLLAVRGGQIEPRAQTLHPDGDRFIFAVPEGVAAAAAADGGAEPERVVLVQNFAAELARLLSGN
jgi:serine/threonine-protein kinase